jgi:phosphoglycerol transferase MdoB-like AlkP superfamily enzyme
VFQPFIFTLVIFPVLFLVIRGGFNAIPISQSSAHYSHHSILNWASVNSGYHLAVNLLETNRYKKHNAYEFYGIEEAKEIVGKINYVEQDTTISILNTRRPNIVILLLESWTADLIESLGAEPGITPNFKDLEKEGLLFTQFYCTGNRSHEALATLFGGHPALPYTTWTENPEKYRKMPSMVRVLNDAGYNSSFYFGGELDYGNMRAYLLFNQFGKIVEEKDIDPALPRGRLGVHDEFLFDLHLKDAGKFPEPFFSVVFTMSSHSPYDQPMESVIDWAGPNNDFLNSAYYTDKCLGEYFERARQEPWFDSTLFILMADHGHSSQKNWRYESYEYHRVPLLFYGNVLREEFRGKQDSRICDNSSIPRTVLNQLGLPEDQFPWGVNLFNPYSSEFAYVVLNGGYMWKEPGKEIVFAMQWQHYYSFQFPENTPHAEVMNFLGRGKAYVQVLFQEFLDY